MPGTTLAGRTAECARLEQLLLDVQMALAVAVGEPAFGLAPSEVR
jgi:hypothetical protein